MENLKEQKKKKNQGLTNKIIIFLFVYVPFLFGCIKKREMGKENYVDSIQNINQLQNAIKKTLAKNKFNLYFESFLTKWNNKKLIKREIKDLEDILYEENTYFLKDDFDNNGYTDLIIYNKDKLRLYIVFNNEKDFLDIYLVNNFYVKIDHLKYSIFKKDNKKILINEFITYDGKNCADTLIFKNRSFVEYNSHFKIETNKKISKIIFKGKGMSEYLLSIDVNLGNTSYEKNRKKQHLLLNNKNKKELFDLCYYIYFNTFNKKTTPCYENISNETSIICIVEDTNGKIMNKRYIYNSDIGHHTLFHIFQTLDNL